LRPTGLSKMYLPVLNIPRLECLIISVHIWKACCSLNTGQPGTCSLTICTCRQHLCLLSTTHTCAHHWSAPRLFCPCSCHPLWCFHTHKHPIALMCLGSKGLQCRQEKEPVREVGVMILCGLTYKWAKHLQMGRNTPCMQELWWVERITGEWTNRLLSVMIIYWLSIMVAIHCPGPFTTTRVK